LFEIPCFVNVGDQMEMSKRRQQKYLKSKGEEWNGFHGAIFSRKQEED